MSDADLIVVGGGLAGMTAALTCAGRGMDTLLLEAGGALGGRTRSVKNRSTGEEVDNGQHMFIGAFEETLSLLELLGTRYMLKKAGSEYVLVDAGCKRRRMSLIDLPGLLFMPAAVLHLNHLSLMERLSLGRVALALETASEDQRSAWDDTNAEQWLLDLGQSKKVLKGFWRPMIVSALNEEPSRVSALALAVVMKQGFFAGAARAAPMLATTGLSDLFARPAAAKLEALGARVEYGAKVVSFEVEGNRVAAIIDRKGRTWKAGQFVLAVPPWNMEKLESVFGELKQHGYTWSCSPIVTINLWLDRPVMSDAFIGFIEGPVHWIFNHSFNGTGNRRQGYRYSVVTSCAREAVAIPPADALKQALDAIEHYLPKMRKAVVKNHLVLKEKRATIPPVPGQWLSRPGANTSLDNLFLAGDWTSTGLPPTMESAVISGRNAAEAVLSSA
ncbi:MAG: FAD-dependent oxidoreductase [Deltaproteobacteria bacterium]|nr:FAD-dependent oxidoreductase [Deltaproteobacteria bacterium]